MRLPLTRLENIALTVILLVTPPLMLSTLYLLLLVRLGGYIVNLCVFYSYKLIGKLTVSSFPASGVQLAQSTSGLFIFRRVTFSSHLKSKIGNIVAKAADLRVNLNLDGSPISSRTETHPSHSQTSRLLTSSLSLGVPVPRVTQ
jgi:hypothetical protein